jgi:dimethylargininase
VKAIDVHGCLHLRTALTWLGRETLLVHPGWIATQRLPRFDCIEIDPREPFGASGLKIGETIVLSASHPWTAERVASRGFEVRTVDLSEFEKAEGGPSCLSLRLFD